MNFKIFLITVLLAAIASIAESRLFGSKGFLCGHNDPQKKLQQQELQLERLRLQLHDCQDLQHTYQNTYCNGQGGDCDGDGYENDYQNCQGGDCDGDGNQYGNQKSNGDEHHYGYQNSNCDQGGDCDGQYQYEHQNQNSNGGN